LHESKKGWLRHRYDREATKADADGWFSDHKVGGYDATTIFGFSPVLFRISCT
jgi:hypothetical protein